MTSARIADLLSPFLSPAELDDVQLDQISSYLELLLRWNARMNLTAIHTPEHIVTRHFGESLFAARCLFPGNPSTTSCESHDQAHQENPHAGAPSLSRSMRQGGAVPSSTSEPAPHLIDVGSGAGFPGLPIKIWTPNLRVTLIESNQKKATFLREVARTLTLTNVNVFAGRAENYLSASANPNPAPSQPASLNGSSDPRADAVTLRAVERFANILPTAATLVRPGGRLCLLISQEQSTLATSILPSISWHHPAPLPLSETRIVLIGTIYPHEPK